MTASESEDIDLVIETAKHGRQVVPGMHFPGIVPGLVLHRQFQHEDRWRVSHRHSGQCFGLTFPTVKDAAQFLAWMAQGAPLPPSGRTLCVDWRCSLEEISRAVPDVRREVKRRVQRWLDRRRLRERRQQAKQVGVARRTA